MSSLLSSGLASYVCPNESAIRVMLKSVCAHADPPSTARLEAACMEIQACRTRLLAGSPALDAICVSIVEGCVTPILIRHGLDTRITSREYPYHVYSNVPGLPGFHVYNTVQVGDTSIILDMNADPFLVDEKGFVIASESSTLPLYSLGHPHHRRHVVSHGTVSEFDFSYLRNDGMPHVYLRGHGVKEISIAPFHLSVDENYCPISLHGGAVALISYGHFFSGLVESYSIELRIVAKGPNGDRHPPYELIIRDVATAHIECQSPTESKTTIEGQLTNGAAVTLAIGANGALLPGESIRFVETCGDGMRAFLPDPKNHEVVTFLLPRLDISP